MPLTILESIADTLHSRLSAMISDPVTYPIEVREVIRPTQYGSFTPTDRQIVLTQGPAVRNEQLSCPGNPPAVAWDQQFNLRLHIRQDERSFESIDTIQNAFVGDVQKCVCSPGSSWHNFGGYAINARWGQSQPFTSDAIEGVNLPIVITYRVSEDDPYEQR
jgi:hypothetical protein